MNPRSGTFAVAGTEPLRQLAEEHQLQVIEITPELDARKVVREALDAGLRTFVVAGGDGSVHHIAQALVNTPGILGIVPIGSVNHLARDLEIPLEWREAFEVAVSGLIRQIDVGVISGNFFLNSAMLGLHATMSEYRERFRSVHSRWRAYLKAGRLALRHFPHVSLVVEMNGRLETIRTQTFVVAVNSYDLTQAGFVAPKVTFIDGKLSVYSLSFMTRLQFIRAAAKYLRGRLGEVPGFRAVRTASLRIDTGRPVLKVSVDGELMSLRPPVQISAVPGGLLVRAQERRAEDRPADVSLRPV